MVIFDVDDVLVMPTDEFAFNVPVRLELTQKLRERYSKDELRYLYSCVFERRTVQPVDENMRSLIKSLEQRNIPAIALTGWWTGKYGNIGEHSTGQAPWYLCRPIGRVQAVLAPYPPAPDALYIVLLYAH